MVCLRILYPFKFFKGCLPQLSLGPFLNTVMLNEKQLLTFFAYIYCFQVKAIPLSKGWLQQVRRHSVKPTYSFLKIGLLNFRIVRGFLNV